MRKLVGEDKDYLISKGEKKLESQTSQVMQRQSLATNRLMPHQSLSNCSFRKITCLALLLSMVPYGREYLLGQFESALLAMSTPSLLTDGAA